MPKPPLSALFLVSFDNRKGYTLKWHRVASHSSLKLEGSEIEYKCLPSGLHNVEEDLIYFVHDNLIGLAAFQSAEASETERNAKFVSVGILAEREGIWRYAKGLKDLARTSVRDSDDTAHLEQFWDSRASDEVQDEESTADDEEMFEPARTVKDMLETLGPLVFPIYRALLLRKRVLLVSQPPLKAVCDYVNILSHLADIPEPPQPNTTITPPPPVTPLFTIGVHDLTHLATHLAWSGTSHPSHPSHPSQPSSPSSNQEASKAGWLACTSDDLLATKHQLSEYRVRFPSSPHGKSRTDSSPWPVMTKTRSGVVQPQQPQEETVRATKRDLRRWLALRRSSLFRSKSAAGYTDELVDTTLDNDDGEGAGDDQPLLDGSGSDTASDKAIPHETSIVEPLSWAASLNRWSAAGVLDAEEEEMWDREWTGSVHIQSQGEADARLDGLQVMKQLFQDMTKRIFDTLANLTPAADGEYHDNEQADESDETALLPSSVQQQQTTTIQITKKDMLAMGLDIYSTSDVEFIKELTRLYLGREADVEVPGVEVCGIRIC